MLSGAATRQVKTGLRAQRGRAWVATPSRDRARCSGIRQTGGALPSSACSYAARSCSVSTASASSRAYLFTIVPGRCLACDAEFICSTPIVTRPGMPRSAARMFRPGRVPMSTPRCFRKRRAPCVGSAARRAITAEAWLTVTSEVPRRRQPATSRSSPRRSRPRARLLDRGRGARSNSTRCLDEHTSGAPAPQGQTRLEVEAGWTPIRSPSWSTGAILTARLPRGCRAM